MPLDNSGFLGGVRRAARDAGTGRTLGRGSLPPLPPLPAGDRVGSTLGTAGSRRLGRAALRGLRVGGAVGLAIGLGETAWNYFNKSGGFVPMPSGWYSTDCGGTGLFQNGLFGTCGGTVEFITPSEVDFSLYDCIHDPHAGITATTAIGTHGIATVFRIDGHWQHDCLSPAPWVPPGEVGAMPIGDPFPEPEPLPQRIGAASPDGFGDTVTGDDDLPWDLAPSAEPEAGGSTTGTPVAPSRLGVPPAGTRDTKLRGAGAAARFGRAIGYNALTEFRDFTKCLWQNIPPEYRKYWGNPTLSRQVEDISSNLSRINWTPWESATVGTPRGARKSRMGIRKMPGALACIGGNAVQDFFYGLQGLVTAQATNDISGGMAAVDTLGRALNKVRQAVGGKDPLGDFVTSLLAGLGEQVVGRQPPLGDKHRVDTRSHP